MSKECPICKADKSFQVIESKDVYGGKKEQVYYLCKNCDLYYLYPKPTQDELNQFYSDDFEEFMENRSGSDSDWKDENKHFEINKREFDRRIPFLKDSLKTSKNILEVGASSGFMLSGIKKDFKNIELYAVEPSKKFNQFMLNNKINSVRDIKDLDDNLKFDLIIHFYVIAHVTDMESFIMEYYNKLKIGGKMIFETPSATEPLYQLYDIPAFKKFYWQVAHIYSFTNKSMEYFLNKLGFKYKIIPHQRYDLSNHMVWMQTGKAGGRDKYSNIFSKKLELEYKQSLEDRWLCDGMIVEIEKI